MAEGVGARLRAAREQRGLSLAEVEAATKIRTHLLAAIEAEQWERLPGDYYARAFLREYAEFLELDPEPVLAGYRPAGEPAEPLPAQIKSPPRTRTSWSTWLRAGAALAALAVAGALVAVVVSSIGGGSNPEPGTTSTPATATAPPATSGGGAEAPATTGSRPATTTLTLTATAEVWVCLLDHRETALVNGQILAAGEEVGPFRSAGFTLSLGNGEVEVGLDGRPASIPASSDPVGYAIDAAGDLRELAPEARPTCT